MTSSSLSYMTSQAFVTVGQFACLHWKFLVSDTWLCPQQDPHRCLEQPCRIGWLVEGRKE